MIWNKQTKLIRGTKKKKIGKSDHIFIFFAALLIEVLLSLT